MSHSLVKIWIHLVFGTKNRNIIIPKDIRAALSDHLTSQLEEKNCKVRITNTVKDHTHSLFLLPADIGIADLVKGIKGESSHWINRENLMKNKFVWQVGYGAFSIGESTVKEVGQYIRKQEEHHLKMTYQEEYEKFMKIYFPEMVNR